MYKEIGPQLTGLGIKELWEGNNSSETQVYDITNVKDPSKFEVLTKRDDITARRTRAGVELQSQEIITKDYCA